MELMLSIFDGDSTIYGVDWDSIIKISLAVFFGLLIGLERELRSKQLGLKTCVVICVSSCLLTIVSIRASYVFPRFDHMNMDPLRLAAQIVSGVGFLGAGVIVRRSNESVGGLTTAAILWGSSGIGITIGAGFLVEAAVGVFLMLTSVELLPIIIGLIGPKRLRQKRIFIQLIVFESTNITKITKKIEDLGITINHLRIKDLDNGEHLLEVRVSVFKKRRTTDVYNALQKMEKIRSVDIEMI